MEEKKKTDAVDMACELSIDLASISAQVFLMEIYFGGLADYPACVDRISDDMLSQTLMGIRRSLDRAVNDADKIAITIGQEEYTAYKMGKNDVLGTGAAVIANADGEKTS